EMSGEENLPNPSEEEIDEDEEETITAVAPAVVFQEEELADVTTSPAFQCLDEVSSLLYLYMVLWCFT
ncbi:hypothetical protein scyTo_0013775, partial [Scyliorhinus torazame]|nr:hypothetical protein [Scyliorhinus torazame]